MIRLHKATSGEVFFNGDDVMMLRGNELRRMRRNMSIIFQDPAGSLNPKLPVGEIIGEPLIVHNLANKKEREELVLEIMETVGLRPEYPPQIPTRKFQVDKAENRHRQVIDPQPEIYRGRRTNLSSRCINPVTGHQPPGRPSAQIQTHISIHRT